MDKFEPDEVIYERTDEINSPKVKESVDKLPDVEDHDHCVYTPFIPKKADLHICPCGCEYGYIEQNEKWYTREQIKEIKE